MGRIASVVAWTAVWLSGVSSPALAQTPPTPATTATSSTPALSEYDIVVRKALAEFSYGHYSEAKALFQRAHELRPSARTLRSLGLTSFELRQYVSALSLLQQALASQEHPLSEEMRRQVLAVADDCRSFIIYRPLRLQPSQAELQIDGEPAVLDAHGALMLDPGAHTLRVEADGFASVTRELVANGGDHAPLEIELAAIAGSPAEEPRSVAAAPSIRNATAATTQHDLSFWESLDSGRIVGLGLGAAGVIGAGLGAVFSVLALNDDRASERHCEGNTCDPQGVSQRESALAHADAATVSFIAAGACLGAGLITYIAAPGRGTERERTRLRLRSAAGPGVASLTLAGAL